VNEYITNLLDGNITLQYEDVELKSEKKPVEYVDKIEKWLEFRNRVRDEDPDEFTKLTGELFTHLLAIRLGGVIVDHTCNIVKWLATKKFQILNHCLRLVLSRNQIVAVSKLCLELF